MKATISKVKTQPRSVLLAAILVIISLLSSISLFVAASVQQANADAALATAQNELADAQTKVDDAQKELDKEITGRAAVAVWANNALRLIAAGKGEEKLNSYQTYNQEYAVRSQQLNDIDTKIQTLETVKLTANWDLLTKKLNESEATISKGAAADRGTALRLVSIVLLISGAAVVGIFAFVRKRLDSKGKHTSRAAPFVVVSLWTLWAAVFTWAIGVVTEVAAIAFIGFAIGVIALFGISLTLCALIADMARSKGRNWAAFFWLSILFSPLIMWIIAATISPLPGSSQFIPAPPDSTTSEFLDPANEIKKLGELREQGLITKGEFESKKKELLDRI